MLQLGDLDVTRICKGELVLSRRTDEDFAWETVDGGARSVGALLLDFNNFSRDKTVFLLHPADYMEPPSLLTLVRMAKYCELESGLALLRLKQISQPPEPRRRRKAAFWACLRTIHRVSRTALDWSYACLKRLVRLVRHSTTALAQDSDESDEDIVLKILTQWSPPDYRAALGPHERDLGGAHYELYQEIFEHLYAIFFRLKVCDLRFIMRRWGKWANGAWWGSVCVVPRVATLHDRNPFDPRVKRSVAQCSPKYFTPDHFVRLWLCGNRSNFTRTRGCTLPRSFRMECDQIGDHHQLLRIRDNARVVAHNIRLLLKNGRQSSSSSSSQEGVVVKARRMVVGYNARRMRRILARGQRTLAPLYMGLSARPRFVWRRSGGGSDCEQDVCLDSLPTWFRPRPVPLTSGQSVPPPLLCDQFFWTNPAWRTCPPGAEYGRLRPYLNLF